jgi:hypothetical protein
MGLLSLLRSRPPFDPAHEQLVQAKRYSLELDYLTRPEEARAKLTALAAASENEGQWAGEPKVEYWRCGCTGDALSGPMPCGLHMEDPDAPYDACDVSGVWFPGPSSVMPSRVKAGKIYRVPLVPAAWDSAWRTYVEPGITGPLEPVEGFTILVAEKREEEQEDGVFLHFLNTPYVWRGGTWHRGVQAGAEPEGLSKDDLIAWRRAQAGGGEDWWLFYSLLPRTSTGRVIPLAEALAGSGLKKRAKASEIVTYLRAKRNNTITIDRDDSTLHEMKTITPDCWPASTPFGEIAEAWESYRAEVFLANRSAWEASQAQVWQEYTEQRTVALERERREQQIAAQRGIAALLPGPTVK